MHTLIPMDFEIRLALGDGEQSVFTLSIPKESDSSSRPVPGISLAVESRWEIALRRARCDLTLQNRGERPVRVETLRICAATHPEATLPDWRVFLDAGECAWCGVKRLDALAWSPAFDLIAEQRIKEPQKRPKGFHRSSLQTVIYDANRGRAWLLGFLSQRCGYNGVDVFPDEVRTSRLARFEAWQLSGVLLEAGDTLAIDPFVMLMSEDPLDLLEEFAGFVQDYQDRSFDAPPVVGMMTWYGYRTAIDETIVLENAQMVADLFAGYPQPMKQIMLLDHGWQPDANWGYWDEADAERFPEGLPFLNEKLQEMGLELGLWYTPFCITENCPTWDAIRPLMALDSKTAPHQSYACVWGQLPGHSAGNWPIYFFDGSLEGVQSKWVAEMRRMAEDWGCVYWKLDFFALLPSDARRDDHPIGELYARTYHNFRKATGERAHLAPCSCDTNIQLGYNDSIRIAADIGNAGTWPTEMSNYARGLTTIAALWYKHRRFWVNDPDSIQVGCGCGLNEARVRATAVAFSGGHLMISEDLRRLSPERIEIIRRLLPAYGLAARPLDLFEHVYPDDIPHIWRLPVDSDWGACEALAVFNLNEDVLRVEVLPEWFGLSAGQAFGVMEWWQQRWLGRFEGPFEVLVPPADVAVLHAQAYRPYPWLISCSHHFTGGWIVENLSFDLSTQQLKGELVTKADLGASLIGTLPQDWFIPPNSDFHGRGNGAGGWAYEVRTNGSRTPFAVQFAKRAGSDV